jgi:hypothetical protein
MVKEKNMFLEKRPPLGDYSFLGNALFDYEPAGNYKDPPTGREIVIPITDADGSKTGDTVIYYYSHSYWVHWPRDGGHSFGRSRCHKYYRKRQGSFKMIRGG